MKLSDVRATRPKAGDQPDTIAKKQENGDALRIGLRDKLIASFNGAIKYEPFTADIFNGHWDKQIGDADVFEFALQQAKQWHETAAAKHAQGDAAWNNGTPYCRNIWKDAV